jgi:hypothetical protein
MPARDISMFQFCFVRKILLLAIVVGGGILAFWFMRKGEHLDGMPIMENSSKPIAGDRNSRSNNAWKEINASNRTANFAVGRNRNEEPLEETDIEERARQYEMALTHPETVSTNLLYQGLSEENATIRFRVLSQALRFYEKINAEVLENLAQRDPDSAVRRTALSAIAFHPDISDSKAEAIGVYASSDDDLAVSSAAIELLDHLNSKQSVQVDLQKATLSMDNSEQAAVPIEPPAVDNSSLE